MTNNPKTFTSALEKAIAHSSMEVLNGETQLYSLVADYLGGSPQSRQSLNLLRNAIDCGIPARMYGAATKDANTQTITVATCRKLLMDNYSISEEAADQFMNEFAEALGWEVEKPKPANKNTVTGTVTGTVSAPKSVTLSHEPVGQTAKPVPNPSTERREEKSALTTPKAATPIQPAYPDNPNAMNLFNGGRVAYHDGYCYFSDLFKSTLFGVGGLFRCKIENPAAKERIFKQKKEVMHINVADGFLYAMHEPRKYQQFAEIIKINLSNLNECSSLYSGISCTSPISGGMYADSVLWSTLQLYDGWLYFSKSSRSFCRMRTDGSDLQELGNPVSQCFINNGTILYHCFEEYTSKNETAKNELYRMDLDGSNRKLLFESDMSLSYKMLYGNRIYYTRYEPSCNRYQIYSRSISGGDKQVVGTPLSRHGFINIQKDTIFYIAVQELRKMRIDGSGDELICKLEDSAKVLGIQVYEDWIFLDFNFKGILAISQNGKNQVLLK